MQIIKIKTEMNLFIMLYIVGKKKVEIKVEIEIIANLQGSRANQLIKVLIETQYRSM